MANPRPIPPWVVISTLIYVAGLTLIIGFDSVPAVAVWPMRICDVTAGIGIGRWLGLRFRDKRQERKARFDG